MRSIILMVIKMFPKRLRELRKQYKLTAKEFGEKFNLAESTISGYETGARKPDMGTLEKFADFFNVSVDYLLGRTDDPTPPDRKDNQNALPPLTPKDERDIARDLERIMNNLESDDGLAFYGEPMDEQTKELLRISLENSMRLAKQMAKQKFTPKKYRKRNGDE